MVPPKKLPMRLAMKLGVSLLRTTPLPRRRSANSSTASRIAGSVSGPGNQLQQMQIARRIEEVRAQEVAAELGRKAFRDLRQRNAAGVGGNESRPACAAPPPCATDRA